jgi:hypothetical protein
MDPDPSIDKQKNLHSKRSKQKKFKNKTYFLLASGQALTKKAESGSVPKCHGLTTLL